MPAFDRRLPTMLVVGTAIEERDPHRPDAATAGEFDDCCRIADLLRRHDYNLLNNACPGIPDLIMKAFTGQAALGIGVELSILRSPWETDSTRAYSPTGFPISGNLTIFCNIGFELLSALNARCADCVLVIGGGLGSLLEAAACVMHGLPVVCFTQAGGVATEIEAVFSRYKTRYKELDVTTCTDLPSLETALARHRRSFANAGKTTSLAVLIDELARAEQETKHVDIDVAPGLTKLTYSVEDAVAVVENPVLVIDPAAIPPTDKSRSVIAHALQHLPRCYSHDGIRFYVTPTQIANLWGPSIDSFILIDVLRGALAARDIASALDVGCGTGFVALWLAARCARAKILGIDPNPDAVHCARLNAARQVPERRVEFRTERLEECRPERGTDLMVCNPPYLPGPDGVDGDGKPYGGTRLLRFLLAGYGEFLSPGGECYLTISSLSHKDGAVRDMLRRIERETKGGCVHRRRVPFKVDAVLADTAWRNFLFPSGADPVAADRPYWHEVEVWRLHR